MNKLKYSLKPETVLIFHFLWNCIFYYCYYCDLNVLIFLQFWQIAWAAYLILSTHHHIINMINIRFCFVFKNNHKWMLTAWASNIVFLIHSEAIQAEISDHNQRDSLMGGNCHPWNKSYHAKSQITCDLLLCSSCRWC